MAFRQVFDALTQAVARLLLPSFLVVFCSMTLPSNAADALGSALKNGKVSGHFRLRYERVEQENTLNDAQALTLRSQLGYKTADLNGFYAQIEFEDVRSVFGVDRFSVPPTGFKPGQFSVIADPDSTEVDQLFVAFQSDQLEVKLGRQLITHDGHRFIGHVGWRQDRQTFDGARLIWRPAKAVSLELTYLTQRNRIFADQRDIDSADTLLRADWAIGDGKLVAYGYLLDAEQVTNGENDTWGINYRGKQGLGSFNISYLLEYARQDRAQNIKTDYIAVEAATDVAGLKARLGMESLGSDDGRGGFATPLATLHKFNGWNDQFLGTPDQGLQDIYLGFSGSLWGGKWSAILHDYSADVKNADGSSDLGDEVNLSFSRDWGDHWFAGIKFGAYSAGDSSFNKVDTDKYWVWAGAKF